MRGRFAGSSVRSLAGVLLGLLACVLAAPSKVQAGCNAHVTLRDGRDHLARYLDPLILGEAGRTPDASSAPTIPWLPRPCSGPSCSDNQGPPAPPTVSL